MNLRITRREDEPFETLLRRFTKACEKDEIIKYYKKHCEYESPSIKRKRKHQAALRRIARDRRKAEQVVPDTNI